MTDVRALCPNSHKGMRCVMDLDHGGTVHVSASNVEWPMHLPYVDHDARRLEEIDRNARAYGWEVGRGHLMVDRLEDCDPANPFLDPNWRENIQVPEKPGARCGVKDCEQRHG